MTDLTAQQIEELERKEAAATPMGWTPVYKRTNGYLLGIEASNGAAVFDAEEYASAAWIAASKEDIDFTCSFRNAAKPLLAMVKRQGNEIADLRRQLAERDAFIAAFKQFAPKCGQLLDGWHCDVAWSEADTEVRNELTALHLRAYQEPKP